jgi:hypothetical protein
MGQCFIPQNENVSAVSLLAHMLTAMEPLPFSIDTEPQAIEHTIHEFESGMGVALLCHGKLLKGAIPRFCENVLGTFSIEAGGIMRVDQGNFQKELTDIQAWEVFDQILPKGTIILYWSGIEGGITLEWPKHWDFVSWNCIDLFGWDCNAILIRSWNWFFGVPCMRYF